MAATEATQLLDRFARGPSLAIRSEAVTRLLDEKLAVRHSKDPRFIEGVSFLERVGSDASGGIDRLTAIAELVRISQVVKTLQTELRQRLKAAFANQLPSAQELQNSDGRFYVARACTLVSPGASWLATYTATAAADEEASAAKIRGEFLAALLLNVTTLAEFFRYLSAALSRIDPAKEKPGDSVGRRVTNILSGVRPLIVSSTLPPGEGVGVALTGVLKEPFSAFAAPESESVRLALTKEVILVVFDLVRTRFSVSSDADTYSSVQYTKRFFKGSSSWPESLRDPLRSLQAVIAEAILLLGKQDVLDATLMQMLELVCGYPERARAVAKSLADDHPALPERVKAWLRTGRIGTAQAADPDLIESGLQGADPILANILVEVDRVARDRPGVASDALSALGLYEPRLQEVLRSYLSRGDDLVREIENLASKRRLRLYGTVGERMEFSSKYFEFVGPTPKQEIVVVRPAVVRVSRDGSIGEAVKKGLAE